MTEPNRVSVARKASVDDLADLADTWHPRHGPGEYAVEHLHGQGYCGACGLLHDHVQSCIRCDEQLEDAADALVQADRACPDCYAVDSHIHHRDWEAGICQQCHHVIWRRDV